MNTVWTFAICAMGFPGARLIITSVNGVTRLNTTNTTVPIRLNSRWIAVARFALRVVPMEARTAVIQVPMFCPNRTNTALYRSMTPLMARACKIPTDAEEDWISAVKPAPTRMPRSGLLNFVIISTNCGSSLKGDIAELIISIPIKSTPMPATIPAICWIFLFFTNTRMATPTKAIRGARAPTSRAIS